MSYILRVIREKKKLDKKLTKLVDFIDSVKFNSLDEDAQNLLIIQSSAMATYSNVLNTRIISAEAEGE